MPTPQPAVKPSRNKHDLCDIANWLVKISDDITKTGMNHLQSHATNLKKFSKRMKEIAQKV